MTEKQNYFHFRSKFQKLLNDQNHSVVTHAFQKFCYEYDSACAESFLWKLTYDPQISAPYLLSDIGLDYNIISDQNLLLFRNELRYQYKQINKNFLEPQLEGSCKEAFDELHHQSDIIVAHIVYDHCQRALTNYTICNKICRIHFLLSSYMDNRYFGGLRALGFDMLEAEYLKPFHKLIDNLLLELYNNHTNINDSENIQDTETFEDPVISYKTADLSAKSTCSGNEVPQFEPLTPENILLYKDIFSEFVKDDDYNLLLQIGHLGFDLNKVMSKKIKIADFLKAAKALSE